MDASSALRLVVETMVATRASRSQFAAGVSAALRAVCVRDLQPQQPQLPQAQKVGEGRRQRKRLAQTRRRASRKAAKAATIERTG